MTDRAQDDDAERPEDSAPEDIAPDYEGYVGYGHPPRHSRWQKGQSGNLNGRPRKAASRQQILQQIADRRVEITENGQIRTVSVLEAIILRVRNDAIAGSAAAASLMDKLSGISMEHDDEQVPKGVLFAKPRLSEEDWIKKYGNPES